MEHCGTPCYMAPEVKSASRKKVAYAHPADWYTLGVLMYELTEQNLPFGDDPKFTNAREEYRRPQMLDEKGKTNELLHDLVLRLLEWAPNKRLGAGAKGAAEIQKHKYWGDVEWQLVNARKLPSPLLHYVQHKGQPRPEKLRKQQRAAQDTAQNLSTSDAAAAKAGSDGNTVDGWDFVSPQALSTEYIENQSNAASIL